jgi:hypothetical protein
MEVACFSEMVDEFHRLDGVISQKKELSITTAVRNPNPRNVLTTYGNVYCHNRGTIPV